MYYLNHKSENDTMLKLYKQSTTNEARTVHLNPKPRIHSINYTLIPNTNIKETTKMQNKNKNNQELT